MNNSNTGTCTLACKNPICGDTFVQPGKGEQCDDGNQSSNDACLNTCKTASCGDGVVYAGRRAVRRRQPEQQRTSAATSASSPTCSDGVKNGSETDVDCGGSCGKCGLDLQCTGGLDCASGYCNAGKCGIATNCKAIKQASPGAGNGVYPIDPDGAGAQQPFNAFCEMTIDGGGWTLALKANGTQSTFTYAAALWTNTATHQPQFPDLDHNEAKLQSFNTVPFNDLLVGMEYPIGNAAAAAEHHQARGPQSGPRCRTLDEGAPTSRPPSAATRGRA